MSPPAGAETSTSTDDRRGIESFGRVTRVLADEVARAAARGRNARAVGTRWPLDAILRTDDVTVEDARRRERAGPRAGGLLGLTRPMTGSATPPEGILHAALSEAARDRSGAAFACLEAGAVVDDATRALDDAGLAVPTASSSSGQTIAGVLATSSTNRRCRT